MSRATAKKASVSPVDILQAMADPHLFAPHFRDMDSWKAWRAFLAALFALPMDSEALATYQACTGRAEAPSEPAKEAWIPTGRRGGKSRILALIAVYLATFRDWRPYLAPGEKGYVTVIAADRRQARTIMNYVRAFLTGTPLLAPLVAKDNTEDIELTAGVVIEVATCSYRTIRGRTIIAALCDEIAFWSDDTSANPDTEVLAALRPAMATIPGALLLAASSPYAKRGALWQACKRHFGKDGPVLVWRAPTRVMNPSLPQSVIDEAYEADPASAAAEFGAEFRSDVASFLDRQLVENAVDADVLVRSPAAGITYRAFADPSGGASDAFTLGIAHAEGDAAILDCLYERKPPFSPVEVVGEVAALLRSYGLTSATGDRYAAQWVVDAFARANVTYTHSERDRSAIYADCLPLFTSGRARLIDNPRLVGQFAGLERRTTTGGRDRIDHAPGAHDDLSNAAAGALTLAVKASTAKPTRAVFIDFMSR